MTTAQNVYKVEFVFENQFLALDGVDKIKSFQYNFSFKNTIMTICHSLKTHDHILRLAKRHIYERIE